MPLCSDARIHGRCEWNESPFTRLLFVSNLLNMAVLTLCETSSHVFVCAILSSSTRLSRAYGKRIIDIEEKYTIESPTFIL